MNSKTFLIPAMMEEDADIIEAELEQINGVREVSVHQPTHSVTVSWADPATWDDILFRLRELNFNPDLPQPW